MSDPTITSSGDVSLPALTFTPLVQNHFAPAFYANAANTDLLLDEKTGSIYQIAESISNDNGSLVIMDIRMVSDDGGKNVTKFCSSLELIGDKVSDTAYLGYSDNDYKTYSSFRPVNLNADRSQLRRCGKFRRRSYRIIYFGAFPLRLYSLESTVTAGMM